MQGVQRLDGQPAVERHVAAAQFAAKHHDVDVVLWRQRRQHAEVVGDHGDFRIRQGLGQLDGGGARVDGDGVTHIDQGRGADADAALFVQMGGAFRFVVGLGQRAVDDAAVDRAAVSARHHPAFGQITQVLAHGLRTHAETIDEGGDLDASLLADEFADLEASLTGVAGRGHGVFRRVGESMPHFDIFRY